MWNANIEKYSKMIKVVKCVVVLFVVFFQSCSEQQEKDYNVSLLAYPEHGGKLDGMGVYEKGSNVVVEAIPNPGFVFKNWREADTQQAVATNAVHSFVINESKKFIGVFEQEDTGYLIVPGEQRKVTVITDPGNDIPLDQLLVTTRYIGDDFKEKGISNNLSGLVSNDGIISMVINTKDLTERGLYRNITGGGPHIWLSKQFGSEVYPWKNKGQYLTLKATASVPLVYLEDAAGKTGTSNFSASQAPVTQLSFGFYIRDMVTDITFAYIVPMYESRGSYPENANAHDTFVSFVSTPIESSSMYITKTPNSAMLQSEPYDVDKTFEVQLTRENLEKVIKDSKTKMSSDFSRYKLTMAGILFELPNYVENGHNISKVKIADLSVAVRD